MVKKPAVPGSICNDDGDGKAIDSLVLRLIPSCLCCFFAGLLLSHPQGKGYTIRSFRSTYITNMLADGKSPYVIARNTGHSLEVLRRNYEQLSEEQLDDELLD